MTAVGRAVSRGGAAQAASPRERAVQSLLFCACLRVARGAPSVVPLWCDRGKALRLLSPSVIFYILRLWQMFNVPP